jgi:TonB family protein
MRVLIAILMIVLGGAGNSAAQDDPLPQSVAIPFVAYQEAIAEQDYQNALEQARRAWQAAEAEEIELELRMILAMNYGQLATAQQRNDEALQSWSRAAEIADAIQASPADRADAWHSASVAAFRLGENAAARAAAGEVREILGDVPDALPQAARAAHHLVAAISNFRDRRFRDASPDAIAYLETASPEGADTDPFFADLSFMAGLGQAMRDEWSDAAYHMHNAHEAYEIREGERSDNADVSGALASLFESYVDEADFWGYARRMTLGPYPVTRFDYTDPDSGIRYLQNDVSVWPVPRWRSQRLTGSVDVRARVNDRGGVEILEVSDHGLGRELDEAIRAGMERWRFNVEEQYGPSAEGLEVFFHAAYERGQPVRDRSDEDEESRYPPVIERAEPRYPLRAAQRGQQGFTVVRFDLTDEGRPINAQVIFSLPSGAFDAVSEAAVQDWLYEPVSPDRPDEVREGLVTRFDFRLAH